MFKKYPKIKILGDQKNEGILNDPTQIVIQEKVDGANFGFYVEDNILYFCSRNQNLTDSKQIEESGIPKRWRGIEPVLTSFKNNPKMFNVDLYYWGESLQKHNIEYDNIPGFIGFDILDLETNRFLNSGLCEDYFDLLDLSFINTIESPKELTIENLKSLYATSAYRDGPAEGIVIKNYTTQQFAKIVSDEFKETKLLKKVQIHPTNEIEICYIYATDARIEKIIHKLHDDGNKIEIQMMKNLFKNVAKDILEEEILSIYSKYDSINFKNLNKLISKRCIKVLKDIIYQKV